MGKVQKTGGVEGGSQISAVKGGYPNFQNRAGQGGGPNIFSTYEIVTMFSIDSY